MPNTEITEANRAQHAGNARYKEACGGAVLRVVCKDGGGREKPAGKARHKAQREAHQNAKEDVARFRGHNEHHDDRDEHNEADGV